MSPSISSSLSKRNKFRDVDLFIVILMAAGPLQWITIFDAFLSIKPFHIALLFPAFFGFLGAAEGRRKNFVCINSDLTQRAHILFGIYMIYSVFLLFSSTWSDNVAAALRLSLKNAIYLILFYGLFLYLIQRARTQLIASVGYGAIASVALFLIVSTATLYGKGKDPIFIVIQGIAAANPNAFQFGIFIPLFNEDQAILIGNVTGVSLRHTALGFIIICIVTLAIYLRENYLSSALKAASLVTILVAFFIIILSVSRSLIFICMVAVSLIVFSAFLTVDQRRKSAIMIIQAGICFVFIWAFIFPVVSVDLGGVMNIVQQRFDLSSDARWGMFADAIDIASLQPIYGQGAGFSYRSSGSENLYQIHNIFLASLVQVGVIGLFLILFFFYAWLYIVYKMFASRRDFFGRICILCLFLLPAIRSLISGASGLFGPSEWMAFALGLGLLVVEKDPPVHRVSTTYVASQSDCGPEQEDAQ